MQEKRILQNKPCHSTLHYSDSSCSLNLPFLLPLSLLSQSLTRLRPAVTAPLVLFSAAIALKPPTKLGKTPKPLHSLASLASLLGMWAPLSVLIAPALTLLVAAPALLKLSAARTMPLEDSSPSVALQSPSESEQWRLPTLYEHTNCIRSYIICLLYIPLATTITFEIYLDVLVSGMFLVLSMIISLFCNGLCPGRKNEFRKVNV